MRLQVALTAALLAEVATGCVDPAHADLPSVYNRERAAMVRDQIERRGVRNQRVLQAMREVPRHLFVPESIRRHAYEDRPLPIGHDQTISQPFIVASMTELLQPKKHQRVLEIGTGSGYQAAVLSKLVRHVYSIEIVEPLAKRAKATLHDQGYRNVTVIYGDGYRGLPKHAPFDAVIVTAAPPRIPEPLVTQLAVGGRMVLPVGETNQTLQLLVKTSSGTNVQKIYDVRFVPMTGEVQR